MASSTRAATTADVEAIQRPSGLVQVDPRPPRRCEWRAPGRAIGLFAITAAGFLALSLTLAAEGLRQMDRRFQAAAVHLGVEGAGLRAAYKPDTGRSRASIRCPDSDQLSYGLVDPCAPGQ